MTRTRLSSLVNQMNCGHYTVFRTSHWLLFALVITGSFLLCCVVLLNIQLFDWVGFYLLKIFAFTCSLYLMRLVGNFECFSTAYLFTSHGTPTVLDINRFHVHIVTSWYK